MNKSEILYNKISNQVPFCFIKMNDGEFASITNTNSSISRGIEKNSPELSKKLLECLHYQAPNYYIGIPCEGCNKFQHDEILKMCPNNKSSFLNAHTLINDNYNATLDILSKSLVNQNIVIILFILFE